MIRPFETPIASGRSSPNTITPNRSVASFQSQALGGTSSGSDPRSSSMVVSDSATFQMGLSKQTETGATLGAVHNIQ